MEPKTDLEQGDEPCIKSEEDYPDYVAVYDSVKDEHWDGVNQVKTENRLLVEVKSEKLDTEPTVNSMQFKNMDPLTLIEEFEIKSEYVEDTISDLPWDRIEEKLEPGVEADSIADQIKMEFQVSEWQEEKPCMSSANFENTGALGLTEEIDIKSESDESDDLEFDSARMKKNWRMEQKYSDNIYECIHCTFKITNRSKFIRHMIKHNTQKPLECVNCDESFTNKRSLDQHILQKHPEFTTSVSHKIHKCTYCQYKTIYRRDLYAHMMKHTGAKLTCTMCDTSFTIQRSLDNHILQKHPKFAASVSSKIHECTQCEYKTTEAQRLAGHIIKHTGAKLTCTKCDASFTCQRSLDNHILQKHPELSASVSSKIHKCTHCQYKTTYTRLLTDHMIKHTGSKPTCTKCDTSFISQRSLDNHILQKHPKFTASVSSKIHECTHCEFKTTEARHLAGHIMKHTGAKLTCTKCDASFTCQRSSDNHILQKHPELSASVSSKIHKCSHCQYKTTYTRLLADHMIKHTGAKLTCTKCGTSFTSQRSLDNHILQKHPKFTASVSSKIHECTHCEYKTTEARHLAGHVMKHTGAKLTCTKCDASFSCQRSLDNHILQKHPELSASVSSKIHKCTHCQYETTYTKLLADHMIKHTGPKFACTKCDATFTNKRSLNHHILQKHPELAASVSHKIHECTHCQYKTTFTRLLDRHMMKHTGVKRTCTKCDASFTNTTSLDNHILQKHSKFAASVSSKIRECTHCEYKTTYAHCLAGHMIKHTGARLTCTKCDASYTNKRTLDHHILQKHPEFIDSISHKLHECTHCDYKTTYVRNLDRHMVKHTEANITCTKCHASFTNQSSLDNHILQRHPKFTEAVSGTIHECTHCEYKTAFANYLAKHMKKHTAAKLACTNCDASFTNKRSLDHHILQKHPDVTASMSHKIHACTHCQYKTIYITSLHRHMSKHTGAKLKCTKCDASFTTKRSIDNHILQNHPELAASVSHKIYECTHCDYKTTFTQSMKKHKDTHVT
ncbi:unnamed protein product [Acanthoscelides obtectus]|uniref:C2H2-type domain-containing protein n=1 Tax=Acanthoscelides obtectus TaxID=200917 RepID=A0A9P0MJ93_ACAOB|nr:unnamed protein product [Acanthoscelides obtectus]CAK1676195.1 hypothetical protein AOBTE_LOCUS30642 [Acanthoscelides obtectus]